MAGADRSVVVGTTVRMVVAARTVGTLGTVGALGGTLGTAQMSNVGAPTPGRAVRLYSPYLSAVCLDSIGRSGE